jgi:hypothetical protein
MKEFGLFVNFILICHQKILPLFSKVCGRGMRLTSCVIATFAEELTRSGDDRKPTVPNFLTPNLAA